MMMMMMVMIMISICPNCNDRQHDRVYNREIHCWKVSQWTLAKKKAPPETVIVAVFQCFIILHPSPGCLFSTTLNFPHLSASQNLNDEKSPQVPKLSSKYGPDSNYCGLKSVPSLQATNQINAQCFWRGVVLCYEDLNRPRNSTLQAPNDMSITSSSNRRFPLEIR